MCIQCHLRISDADMNQQLQDAIQDPEFEEWNVVSLNHILQSLMGVNGPEAQQSSKDLLEMFYQWFLEGSPEKLNFPDYTISKLREEIDTAENFYNKHRTKDHKELIKIIYG